LNTGQVSSIVGNQVVVKSPAETPKLGAAVYSEEGKAGAVSDIIGAVKKPYLVVKLEENVELAVGDTVRLG
jgi:rRNA processing protein Gar1